MILIIKFKIFAQIIVRSCYVLACLKHMTADYNGTEYLLSLCIGYDRADKLGARHRQLLTVIDRVVDSVFGLKPLRNCLKAKFGGDQSTDDVFALWNYTRSLNSFAEKGNSKASRALLEHAITKNHKGISASANHQQDLIRTGLLA